MNFIHDSLDNKRKHENLMITKFIQISPEEKRDLMFLRKEISRKIFSDKFIEI
jgi:hypothetical protein